MAIAGHTVVLDSACCRVAAIFFVFLIGLARVYGCHADARRFGQPARSYAYAAWARNARATMVHGVVEYFFYTTPLCR